MDYKWFGAILIIAGCGGFGFSLAQNHRKEEDALKQLIRGLDYMACELQFHMTPLPELCCRTGQECSGIVGQVFSRMGKELDMALSCDVESCMSKVLQSLNDIPEQTIKNLILLGSSLGRFDLAGQLKGLEAVRESSRHSLDFLQSNRETRLRSYQTLGLCAGAALAILLI